MTPDNMFVLICDWHGRLTWSSDADKRQGIGQHAWQLIDPDDVEQTKAAFARTATLKENQLLEVRDLNGQFLRMWLWPLDPPDAALCILCLRIPSELAKLTARERDCLSLLASGFSTKLIAAELEIGLSTVHTHIKRIREKLNLPRVEMLISFAARFFHPGIAKPELDGIDLPRE